MNPQKTVVIDRDQHPTSAAAIDDDSESNTQTTKEPSSTYRRWYLVAFILILPAYFVARYGEATSYFLKTLQNLKTIKAKKMLPDRVESKLITEPWPDPSRHRFGNSTRILWGYWDRGEDNLPGLCQLALRSWRARHPHWRVVVVSHENYKQYVSVNDLPSTFDSLIVQHQSDIIRLALLVRYGGAYMDVSTVVFKGLDDIWKTTSAHTLLLTTPIPFSNGMSMANNALLLAPGPNNPVLREWQRRMLAYHEAPAWTVEQMRSHEAFQRVAPLFDDPASGVLKEILPYCSNLWILMDLLYYDEKLRPFIQQNVLSLPTRRWTFDLFSLPFLGYETTHDPTNDPPVSLKAWTKRNLMRSMWKRTLVRFFDDKDRAKLLKEQVNVLKFSSAGIDYHRPIHHHLELDSTMGRLYRAAIKEGPTTQATLKGATRIAQPIADM